MRIERNELIKLFTRKSVLLAIAVIILLNAGLIINNIYGETDRIFDIPAKAYKQVYADISGKSNDEALSFINQKLENCHTNATTNRKLLYTGNGRRDTVPWLFHNIIFKKISCSYCSSHQFGRICGAASHESGSRNSAGNQSCAIWGIGVIIFYLHREYLGNWRASWNVELCAG